MLWGWHTGAPALVVLQFVLLAMNIRGSSKASNASEQSQAPTR